MSLDPRLQGMVDKVYDRLGILEREAGRRGLWGLEPVKAALQDYETYLMEVAHQREGER